MTCLAPNLRPLCRLQDLPKDAGLRVATESAGPFAVFKVGDEVLVIDDTCTHGAASLAEGWLEGDQIECPVHQGRFCLRTGRPMGFPVTKPVRTYPVEIVDGVIHIDVSNLASTT